MKYKLGDEVYLKGVITSINSCAEINYPYEVKAAGEFVTAAEEHLEPINKSELGHAEEAPRYLRNILARLRELPEHDRNVWLKGIMGEFDEDFSHVKWREGYEQGKFDGAVEAEKSKVVIPQFVADWIDYCKENHFTITGAFDPVSEYGIGIAGTFKGSVYKCTRWALDNQNLFARAWLDGYRTDELEELWKPIDGFYNEVSNFGRVRSVTHEAGNGKIYQGKILKPVITKSGYVNVSLVTGNDETRVTKRVHRLVADAFCKNPDDKDEINHKDGSKENNRAENLEWVTRSENEQHAYANNLVKVLKGSKKPCAKLNEEDIRNIRIEYENGCLQIELAERYGVARQTISSIVNRKAWSHVQ